MYVLVVQLENTHEQLSYYALDLGFTASTLTNPIWLVKTRLQLDRSAGIKSLSIRQCVTSIHKELVS